jgi:hypothetical protein
VPALTFSVASLFKLRIWLDLEVWGIAADPNEGLVRRRIESCWRKVILNFNIGHYMSTVCLTLDWILAVIAIAVGVLRCVTDIRAVCVMKLCLAKLQL